MLNLLFMLKANATMEHDDSSFSSRFDDYIFRHQDFVGSRDTCAESHPLLLCRTLRRDSYFGYSHHIKWDICCDLPL